MTALEPISGDDAVRIWRKPRVKPEHHPVRISGNRIRIGGASYGIAAEIHDPTGFVWTILDRLDGCRSVGEVLEAVGSHHPDRSAAEVRKVLVQLAEAGYLEDAGAPEPPELTDRDKLRYERGRQFYRWVDLTPRRSQWDAQVRLRNARVAIVGLGGTGGNAALALAASGVGHIHCVDCDHVELSNLNRQLLYSEKDIGRPKVAAAADRLRELNSDIEVTTENLRIRGAADFLPLAGEHDVLVLCADRPGEIRSWANRACLATATPWVDSGYHGPRANVCVYVPGHGPCYECLWLAEHERRGALGLARPYSTEREGSNAVAAPSAGMCGHLAAHAVISLVTGIRPVSPGQVYGVNLAVPDAQYLIDDPRRADCPACGSFTSTNTGPPEGGDHGDPHAGPGRDQDVDR